MFKLALCVSGTTPARLFQYLDATKLLDVDVHKGGSVSHIRTKAEMGQRNVLNGLPSELRSLPRDLSNSFYKLLKTLLFGRAWAGSASE